MQMTTAAVTATIAANKAYSSSMRFKIVDVGLEFTSISRSHSGSRPGLMRNNIPVSINGVHGVNVPVMMAMLRIC
jgi:hypothetical protein